MNKAMKVVPISINDPHIIPSTHKEKILPQLTPLYITVLKYMFISVFLVTIKRLIRTISYYK